MIAHISLNFAYNAHLGLISVLAKGSEGGCASQHGITSSVWEARYHICYFVLTILYKLSANSTTWGYFYTVGILAVIQVFGYWFLCYQIRDYERYDPDKNLDPYRHWTNLEMVKQIIVNRPLLTILCADIFINIGVYSLQTLAVYYFKYAAQNELLMKPYSLSLSLAVFASAFISPKVVSSLARKIPTLCRGMRDNRIYYPANLRAVSPLCIHCHYCGFNPWGRDNLSYTSGNVYGCGRIRVL
jgi:GPH family glycoside/pentoside/hexuronide:cation symporter